MLQKLALALIAVYQKYVRVCLPNVCRFSPSCSEYTRQAVSKYGFFKGNSRAIKRLLRCQPFSSTCGYDPLE